MRYAFAVALAAIAAAGCVDLPDVTEEGCGNLVLNANEDCDGESQFGEGTVCAAPGSTNACFYSCDPMDEATCPEGWGCGKDFRCRRPSATFFEAPGSPWEFSVDELAVGDVDGDGHVDVIGNDLASVQVRYGAGNGELPTRLHMLTRTAQGPITYADLDADGRLDAVVPIGDGLYTLLGARNRTLEPVAYSPFEIANEHIRMVPVDSVPNLTTEMLALSGRNMEFVDSTALPVLLPLVYTSQDLAGAIAVANIDRDANGRNEFALAFNGANRVWVFTSTGTVDDVAGSNLRPQELAQVLLPGGVQAGAMFADVDGNGWTDLMVSVSVAGQPRVAVAFNNAGVLDATATVQDVFTRQEGGYLWPLAAGDLNADGKADYVFDAAVAIADLDDPRAVGPFGGVGVPTKLVPTAFISANRWREAVFGDFNKDGTVDVAMLTENSDGVSFLLNVGIGLFNKFVIDTSRPPRNLRVGDYDGDFTHDLAFVLDGQGVREDEVAVIFGSPSGGPSQPVSMGKLDTVAVMEPVSMITSLESLDAISDLIVISDSFPSADSKTVAILFGSSSRRMLSPFGLFADAGNTSAAPDIPRRAVVGAFSTDNDAAPDIVALAEPVVDFQAPGDEGGGGPVPSAVYSRLWMIPGKGDGDLDATSAIFHTMPDLTAFQNECATWVAGDLDGAADGRHEIVGVDNNRDCFGVGVFNNQQAPEPRLLIASANPGGIEPFNATVQPITGDERVADQLVLRDLDNDGDLDLLILFAGDVSNDAAEGGDGVVGSKVLVVWNNGGDLSVDNASELELAETSLLYDARSIHLDADGVPELLILADGGVWVSWLDPDTKEYGQPQLLWQQLGSGRAGVGDFNGDGLDDLVYTEDNELVVLLQREDAPLGAKTSEAE